MRALGYFVFSLCLWISPLLGDTHAFLIVEGDQVIREFGDCDRRVAPQSTFKIAIALMGYDSGILHSETEPVWEYKPGDVDWLECWLQPHHPRLWFLHSCLWYSRVITGTLGQKRFERYVKKLNYGSCDVSGDAGEDNGLTHSWLSSSLEISPREQVTFLQRLLLYQARA